MVHAPGFLKIVDDAKSRIKQCHVEDVLQRMQKDEKFVFVDVREDKEWEQGHAKSAIHIGKGVMERDVEAVIPDKNTPIVLYCGGGFRSALSADTLQKMGYKNVISMDGGYKAWVQRGAPVVK